jgi:hypothetical protein
MNHIDIMKQALDALEWVIKGGPYPALEYKAVENLRKAIEEAEKVEPVAWLDSEGFPWSKKGIEWRSVKDTYQPLYTTPPQREWVGLTKQERLKCFGLVSYFDTNCICVEFSAEEIKAASEAIEAKLKEKNT